MCGQNHPSGISEYYAREEGIIQQEEKEIVLILADANSKMAIMKAISQQCGIQSDAKGMVLSIPVDEVAGPDFAM